MADNAKLLAAWWVMSILERSVTNSLRLPRILDAVFEQDLLCGPLQPLLTLVQRDRDLIAEIRTDLLDVYCKGQRLVGVERIRHGVYRLRSHEKFWNVKALDVDNESEVAAFCADTVPFIKQRISEHFSRGTEIEFEQLLVRANNLEELNTDYIAVDRQGVAEEGKGRTDVVGVYWPGDRRVGNALLAPALIEVKYKLGGGVEGIAEQVQRYFDDLRTTLPKFAKELQCQLRQKARLGLLTGLSEGAQSKIQRLTVSDRIEDVQVVIALVDYNPRSTRLNLDALRALPFADQINVFFLGFGLWRSRSAFQVKQAECLVATTVGWVEEVRKGRFETIPAPFRWVDSVRFAHLIDGYSAALELGITKLADFANAKLQNAEAQGHWSGTPIELWLCLYFEHRRARHSGEPEEYADGPHLIHDALCYSLRAALQRLSEFERQQIARFLMSEPPRSAD